MSLSDISTRDYEVRSGIAMGGQSAGRIALTMIALFLVLLACFNYINIAIVSATRRLKEIGIRKVVGSSRKELLKQFLIENLLVSMIAFAVGTLLARFVFLPGSVVVTQVYTVAFAFSSPLLAFFGITGLLLFIVLVSGTYSALCISAFPTLSILKGDKNSMVKTCFPKHCLSFNLH